MYEIIIEKRALTKSKSKRLLHEGMVPAVVYNSKGDSTNIKVNQGDMERLIQNASTSTILDMKLDGESMKGIIKEIDTDPVRGNLRHVSFFEIDPNEESIYEIPIELTGVSRAVKNNLGVLIQPIKAIEVRCKLVSVVDSIVIDITKLEKPGDSITLSDIELPEGMSLPNEDQLNNAVATVSELQKMELETPETDEETDEDELEDGEEREADGESGEEGNEQESTTEE